MLTWKKALTANTFRPLLRTNNGLRSLSSLYNRRFKDDDVILPCVSHGHGLAGGSSRFSPMFPSLKSSRYNTNFYFYSPFSSSSSSSSKNDDDNNDDGDGDDKDKKKPSISKKGESKVKKKEKDGSSEGEAESTSETDESTASTSSNSSSSSAAAGAGTERPTSTSIHSTVLPATINIPDEWSQVPVVAVSRNPVFPKFIKIIEVSDAKLVELIRQKVRMGQPYIGIFLKRDEK